MLNKDEQLIKLQAECEYWFTRSHNLQKAYDDLKLKSELSKEMADDFRAECIDKSNRLELISELQAAQNSTGYHTSLRIGGVTAEGIRKEIEAAKRYVPPFRKSGKSVIFQRPAMRRTSDVSAYITQLEDYIKDSLK